MWGALIGGALGLAGTAMSADATADATKAQIKALEKQRKFVFEQLDPSVIGGQALGADRERIQNQLALQAITDPELLRQRYAAQAGIGSQLQALLGGESAADQVAAQAAEEALAGDPRMQQAKDALIDAALQELQAGATLPPDVQAELVQTGLQRSGASTGGPGATGFGGRILTDLLGTAGLQLQAQRQERAANLLGQAQQLEQSRAAILGNLFPNLQQQGLSKLQAADVAFKTSAAAVPEAGLSGSDVANIWLARVGATNQLAQSAADAAARGGFAQAQLLNRGFGQAASFASDLFTSPTERMTEAERIRVRGY